MNKPEGWIKTYNSIVGRCNHKDSRYYKRGIKCFITKEELKQLWFRDKAYLMKKPSIDRINNDQHYTHENCRYIEHSQNARLGNLGKILSKNGRIAAIKNIEKVNENNLHYRRKIINSKKMTFNSITEAARYYDILVTLIANCLAKRTKTCNGLRWNYAQ